MPTQEDPTRHDQVKETLALLAILARGHLQIVKGEIRTAGEIIGELRARRSPAE